MEPTTMTDERLSEMNSRAMMCAGFWRAAVEHNKGYVVASVKRPRAITKEEADRLEFFIYKGILEALKRNNGVFQSKISTNDWEACPILRRAAKKAWLKDVPWPVDQWCIVSSDTGKFVSNQPQDDHIPTGPALFSTIDHRRLKAYDTKGNRGRLDFYRSIKYFNPGPLPRDLVATLSGTA